MATERSGRFFRGWKWLLVGLVCLGLFALRHSIAGLAVDVLLRQVFSSKSGAAFAYANVEWNGTKVLIDELDIDTPKYRLAVQRLEIVLDFSFSPFHATPHVWIFRPYLIFQEDHEKNSLLAEDRSAQILAAPLAALDWLRLDIVEGRCEWTPRESSSTEDIYFQFVSGPANESIGSLELYATPEMGGDALIKAAVAKTSGEKNILLMSWESRNLSTHHLLPLLWTIAGRAVSGWERIEGGWETKGNIAIDEGGEILDLQSTLSIHNLELRNTELGLHIAARNLALDMQQLQSYELPWYQRIEARAFIEEGEITCASPLAQHPWGMSQIEGHLLLSEKEDPEFSLKGVTIQTDGEKEFSVKGTGSLGSEQSFWLQSYLTWGAEEKPLLQSSLSICSTEPSSLVIEAQVGQLQMSAASSLISLLGLKVKELEDFQFGQGSLKGIVTAWMHGKHLEKIELREGACDKLCFEWKDRGTVNALNAFLEGSWKNNSLGWISNHISFSFQLAEFQPSSLLAYPLKEIEGEGLFEGENISRATIKGKLGEVLFLGVCDGERFQLSSETTFASCLASFFPGSMFDLKSADEIDIKLRFESPISLEGGYQTKGVVLIQNKALVIECNWPKDGGGLVPKGTIHANAIPAAIALPFLKGLFPEVVCQGEIALDGAFHENALSVHIESRDLHLLNQNSFSFSLMQGDLEINSGQIAIENLHAISSHGGLQLKGNLSYDLLQKALKLGEMRGILKAASGAEYAFGMRPAVFLETEGIWEGNFDGAVQDKDLELLHIVSSLRISKDNVIWDIDPRFTHLLGSTIEKGKGIYRFQKKDSHVQGIVNLDLEQLGLLQELSCDAGFVKAEDFQTGLLKNPSSGVLRTVFEYCSLPSSLQFTLEGKNLSLFGVECPYFGCQGKKQQDKWTISECRWGKSHLQFDLSFEDHEMAVQRLEAEFCGLEFCGSALYSFPKREWQCLLESISIPAGKEKLRAFGRQPIVIDCSQENRCIVKGLSLEEIESNSLVFCPALEIDLQNKKFIARTQHRLASKLIHRLIPGSLAKTVSVSPNGPLEANLQIEGSWQDGFSYQVQGAAKECLVQTEKNNFLFSQLSGRFREGTLLLNGKTMLGQLPLLASLQIDGKENGESRGAIKLQESPSDAGLSFFFRLLSDGIFEPSHITGQCSGIAAELRKKSGSKLYFQGTVHVDFTKVRQLFPRETAPPWEGLQLGKGFTLEGAFAYLEGQMGFKGEVRGEKCELLGYEIDSLHSGMLAEKGRLKIDKLQIADPAIAMAVRTLSLEDIAIGKKGWSLSCPIAQVREFRPSRLRKIGKSPAKEKSFCIRNLTLLDVKGELSDLKTFSGDCALHFINVSKKEEGFFDAPLDFLKDVGLEPSVLVPIQGELEGRLENGRLLFTELKSSYSEGRRSQFFLSSRSDSYIDFKGNMHIDLAIRQAVVLKLAESLTLGIRGSFAKPLYVILP